MRSDVTLLSNVEATKFDGVVLAWRLRLMQHRYYLCKKCMKQVTILLQLWNSIRSFPLLWKALKRPKWDEMFTTVLLCFHMNFDDTCLEYICMNT